MTASGDSSDILFNVLQLNDSTFPTGSFSHSFGFEAAEKYGLITGAEKIDNFIVATLENTAYQQVPFVRAAAACQSISELVSIDNHCEACLANHVSRRASQRQGVAIIEAGCFAYVTLEILKKLRTMCSEGSMHGHLPVMYGYMCSALGMNIDTTVQCFMFTTLRNLLAAIVRAGRVGPLQALTLQSKHQTSLASLIDTSAAVTMDEACLRWPVEDVLQATHDTLFFRLFNS